MGKTNLMVALCLSMLLHAKGYSQEQSPSQPPDKADAISWFHSYRDGIAESQKSGKGVFLDFYAEWCRPCKQMEREVFTDPRVIKAASEFVCIRINVDDDEKTTFAYKISTIPRVIFLNKYGEIVGDQIGAVDADQFYDLLKTARLNAYRKLEGGVIVNTKSDAEIRLDKIRERIKEKKEHVQPDEVVQFFCSEDPAVRKGAAELIVEMKDEAVPALVSALSSKYLGLRIASAEVLATMKANSLHFDPWATRKDREESLVEWKRWLSGILEKEFREEDLRKAIDSALQMCHSGKPEKSVRTQDRNADWKHDLWVYRISDTVSLTELDDDFNGKPERAVINCELTPLRMLILTLDITADKPKQTEWRLEHIPSFKEPDLGNTVVF